MSMTMRDARLDGALSKDKILRRQQNLLNLVYLQAEAADGGGYRIPEKVFKLIQTELDFSTPNEKTRKKKEEEIKKRYRQRGSYRFWKDSLDIANISNDIEAKEFLMQIFSKLDTVSHYGSMTHSRYALETLQLALDDVYGTKNLILEQYKFHEPPKKKRKTKTVKAKIKKSRPLTAAEQAALDALIPF